MLPVPALGCNQATPEYKEIRVPLTVSQRLLSNIVPSLAIGLLFSAAGPGRAQTPLSAPVGPEGSARTIGMGNAVAAIGGDAGAVATNPATLTSVGPHGGDDLTVGAGARGTEFFAAHVYGQTGGQLPSAFWGATLSGPQAREDLLAYSVATPDRSGLDVGATLRYERWSSGGLSDAFGTGDIGIRYTSENVTNTRAWSVGASALNLLHQSAFHGTPGALPIDTQVVGAIGYNVYNTVAGELDYVYTSHHRYARAGAELKVATPLWVRAGVADRDYSVGASYLKSGYNVSLSADFIRNQHALFSLGASSKF